MRKIEKQFLKEVSQELTPLHIIGERVNMDFKTAEKFMKYLEKHDELRYTTEIISGQEMYLVAKTIN